MDNGVRAMRERRERRRVSEMPGDELDAETLEGLCLEGIAHQRPDRMSAARQRRGNVPSDEPCATSDGDQHERNRQEEVVPPSSRNTSVRRRATTDASASNTLGSTTVPLKSASRSTAFSGLSFSW